MIVCVSRLVPRKGQDALIRALPAIRRRVPGAALLLVSGGPYRATPAAAGPRHRRRVRDVVVHRLGAVGGAARALRGRRRLRDALPHPQPRASTSRAWASSTWRRPRPGSPVVAGDSGGAPDAVREGETGLRGRRPRRDRARRPRWPPCWPTRTWPSAMGAAGRAWVETGMALGDPGRPDARPHPLTQSHRRQARLNAAPGSPARAMGPRRSRRPAGVLRRGCGRGAADEVGVRAFAGQPGRRGGSARTRSGLRGACGPGSRSLPRTGSRRRWSGWRRAGARGPRPPSDAGDRRRPGRRPTGGRRGRRTRWKPASTSGSTSSGRLDQGAAGEQAGKARRLAGPARGIEPSVKLTPGFSALRALGPERRSVRTRCPWPGLQPTSAGLLRPSRPSLPRPPWPAARVEAHASSSAARRRRGGRSWSDVRVLGSEVRFEHRGPTLRR